MTKASIKQVKASIEAVRQDLLDGLEYDKVQDYNSLVCKVKSAVHNNIKTLSLINRLEKK